MIKIPLTDLHARVMAAEATRDPAARAVAWEAVARYALSILAAVASEANARRTRP